MDFRQRLREEIEYKGIQIKELALSVGISNSTMLSYIDARGVLPNVETAVKIAKKLNVSVEYLVTGEDGLFEESKKALIPIIKDLCKVNKENLKIIQKIIHIFI